MREVIQAARPSPSAAASRPMFTANYQGMLVPGPIPRAAAIPAHRVLTPAARARLPFSLWGGLVALMLRVEARAGELLRDVRPQALGDLVFRNLDRNVGDVYHPWFWRVPCVALCGAPGTLFTRLKL